MYRQILDFILLFILLFILPKLKINKIKNSYAQLGIDYIFTIHLSHI